MSTSRLRMPGISRMHSTMHFNLTALYCTLLHCSTLHFTICSVCFKKFPCCFTWTEYLSMSWWYIYILNLYLNKLCYWVSKHILFFSKFDKDLKIYLILMARLFTRKYGDLVFVYLKTLVSVPFKISHKIVTHIEELTRNS